MSPHLIKYNERISINGNLITDNEFSILVEELKPKIEKFNNIHNVNITLFELETILALLYFYRNNVDFVVLETGLGGLYDCTNIISKPLVSIITSIGYDHMHILGNTLPEIAKQKAGIIKENSGTIFFEQSKEINNVFIKTCKEKNNKLYLLKKSQISNYSYDNNPAPQSKRALNKGSLVFSIITLLIGIVSIGAFFGGASLLLTIFAQNSKTDEDEKAKIKTAGILNVIGIVFGVLFLITYVMIFLYDVK